MIEFDSSVASKDAHAVERPGVGTVGQRLGRVGMGFHEQPGDAGGDRGARQHRHELALPARTQLPCPPGSCTEWVASNTTGQPVARMTASERMSDDQIVVAEG